MQGRNGPSRQHDDLDAMNAAPTAGGTSLAGNWTPGADAGGSGVASTEMCVATTAAGADCSAGQGAPSTFAATSSASAGTATASLDEGPTYRVCARTVDVAGNRSAVACSDGTTLDLTAPTAPTGVRFSYDHTNALAAFDNDTWLSKFETQNLTALNGTWTHGTDAGSGVKGGAACITTQPAGNDCGTASAPWIFTGTETGITVQDLTLSDATTYHYCARTVDNADNVSGASCSTGATTDNVAPVFAFTTPSGSYDHLTTVYVGGSLVETGSGYNSTLQGYVALHFVSAGAGVDRQSAAAFLTPATWYYVWRAQGEGLGTYTIDRLGPLYDNAGKEAAGESPITITLT